MDIEEIGIAIVIALRLFAAIFGFILLLSGFADFGVISTGDALSALSLGPVAMLKIPVGLILVLAGIEPRIINVFIHWMIS